MTETTQERADRREFHRAAAEHFVDTWSYLLQGRPDMARGSLRFARACARRALACAPLGGYLELSTRRANRAFAELQGWCRPPPR